MIPANIEKLLRSDVFEDVQIGIILLHEKGLIPSLLKRNSITKDINTIKILDFYPTMKKNTCNVLFKDYFIYANGIGVFVSTPLSIYYKGAMLGTYKGYKYN